jgi:CubicO group peptidase (beta-lactamase class C family)
MKILLAVLVAFLGAPQEKLSDHFPPPEEKGGWRTLLPESGAPDAAQKAKIREVGGVDWDKLAQAWEFCSSVEGANQLLVIRRGHVVGEWTKDCDRKKAFNIYSSSKSYTSVAWGLLLKDSEEGKLPGGKKVTLDTKVCTEEWLPEALPLSDPRKADITVRHLLNMASGLGTEAVPAEAPFETSLGKTEGSVFAKLKGDPGTVYNYSNAGVAHLVMVFNRAMGKDLHPFLKGRSGRSIRASAAFTPARASTRGSAISRSTAARGRGRSSCPRATTTSPGRARRSSPTTARSGGSLPAIRRRPRTSSRRRARRTTTATSSRASTWSSSAWATGTNTPRTGSTSSSTR